MSPNSLTTFALLALMMAAFYFLIMRPQRKRQQELQRTMASLTPGTRVMTGSGIFGTIVAIGERQAVLAIAPGVEMTVLKQAIVRIATDADDDTFDDGDPDAVDDLDLGADATQPYLPRRSATDSYDLDQPSPLSTTDRPTISGPENSSTKE